MNKPWMSVGDLVSVRRWDQTERPDNRLLSPATVIAISTEEWSETGVMVQVIGASGKSAILDMNWLRPLDKDLFNNHSHLRRD